MGIYPLEKILQRKQQVVFANQLVLWVVLKIYALFLNLKFIQLVLGEGLFFGIDGDNYMVLEIGYFMIFEGVHRLLRTFPGLFLD